MKIKGNINKELEFDERGYALLLFIVLSAMSLFVISGAMNLNKTSVRTIYAAEQRSTEYYSVEESLHRSVSWFRAQSLNMIRPFERTNFYNQFTRTTPTVGTNDVSGISVPTRVKMNGTNNSIILSNSSLYGTSAFPTTSHITTGATFSPTSAFGSAGLGSVNLRATLVDAIAVDPSLDYGPPPAAAPATDFYPIYRVDSLSQMNEGTRLIGYLIGSLFYIDTIGFYGRDFVEARQACDSYISANGGYSAANKRAKCPIGSNGQIRIHQNEQIYGSARTNGSFLESNPFGGPVCTDFSAGCPNPGTKCSGAACAVPGLPTLQSFSGYCPTTQGDRTISANQTWVLGGGAPAQNCWNTVTVSNNRTLTLTSTNHPYYIRTLNFANNSNSRLNIAPNPATGTVTLFVENFSGAQINGNQAFNANNRPSQFRLYYLGTADLTMNGNAQMKAALVAPNAGVTVSGSADYHGGIIAQDLTFTGSGDLHYDESLGGSALSDVTYRLKNELQYYH